MSTQSLPLATADFSYTPTSGNQRLKVVFGNNSTVYDYIEEVEETAVDRYIQEVEDDNGYYIQEV